MVSQRLETLLDSALGVDLAEHQPECEEDDDAEEDGPLDDDARLLCPVSLPVYRCRGATSKNIPSSTRMGLLSRFLCRWTAPHCSASIAGTPKTYWRAFPRAASFSPAWFLRSVTLGSQFVAED